MLLQFPEADKNRIKQLFQKKQPNNSALWCYLDGIMPGKAYVDDVANPTKTICVLDMSWTYISDEADFNWIEETLSDIIRTAWIQVIWVPERGSETPLKALSTVIPRYEFTQRKAIDIKPREVDLVAFNDEMYEQIPWKDFHENVYGSKENFLKKAFGFYAVQDGIPYSEAEAAFTANGYTEIGIITQEEKRRQGFGFAACVRLLEEIDKRGLKPIWACDVENPESKLLAEKLGFINPIEYNFIFLSAKE